MSQLELPMPISGLPLDLRALAAEIHQSNITAGWWQQAWVPFGEVERLVTVQRNVGELLALVHSEISEADHGFELELMDDKLPHRRMAEVELGDVAIRVLDMLGFYAEKWIDDGEDRRFLPTLPQYAYWPDWVRLMHRTTTQALEHFRKGREREGCQALYALLGVVHFAAIEFRYDLTGAIIEKRAFNANRLDHKIENRMKVGGKAF